MPAIVATERKKNNDMIQPQLHIAYFQQAIAWEDPAANYQMVEKAFGSLSSKMDILVVPETFNTGFSDNMAAMAEPPEGATLDFARRMAKQNDALFVGTWTVRQKDGGVVNRLHWVFPDGNYGYYDKGHTFRMSSEASQLVRGTKKALFEWRGWHIKPAICYDLRFPCFSRNKLLQPSDLSLQPSYLYDAVIYVANWPESRRRVWDILLQARALENQCFVIGVNRVGDDPNCHYNGGTVIIDAKGKTLASVADDTVGIATAELDMQSLQTFREKFPVLRDADVISN